MAIKTITLALTGLSLFQPSNTKYRMKDSNARFLIKVFVFFVQKDESKTRFS